MTWWRAPWRPLARSRSWTRLGLAVLGARFGGGGRGGGGFGGGKVFLVHPHAKQFDPIRMAGVWGGM